MTAPRPLLAGVLLLAAISAGCTVVDEPGSHGPERSSTSTVTEAANAATPAKLDCPGVNGQKRSLPVAHRTAIDTALAATAFHGLDISISIWIEGHGEVVAVNADTRLLPASNQKLFTAMGAYALLDPGHRFTTSVFHDGGVLTLVAGGDPTLRLTGPHSLAALARETAAAGVRHVDVLGVDADHFEFDRTALGWQDWHIPDYVGPMSAFMVSDNRYRSDEEFIFGPAVGNLDAFAAALATAGVNTRGARIEATADGTGDLVAAVHSRRLDALLADMLTRSDNETAEAILREIGDGSTAEGVLAIDSALETLCTGRSGQSGDGSGLSRHNLRSAREWRSLLQAAASTPWGEDLRAAMPVAGRTGTLGGRLTGATAAGNVTAKTGSIIGGQALSGYATTSSGQALVFSIIVNGEPGATRAARPAIDALVVAAIG